MLNCLYNYYLASIIDMFKKIEIWILYLVILLSLLAIGFGVLVRQEIEGITKAGSIDISFYLNLLHISQDFLNKL